MQIPQNMPGYLVRGMADKLGWPIKKYNIIVEGEHDQRYINLASCIYFKETNNVLIPEDVSIFPTGIGDAGGAFGIHANYPLFHRMINIDNDQQQHPLYKAIALLDNDLQGRKTLESISLRHLDITKNRDVFLLHRIMPRSTRDIATLTSQFKRLNAPYAKMDCEIEDMLSFDLIKRFETSFPGSFFRPPVITEGRYRCFIKDYYKTKLVNFSEKQATVEDLNNLIDLIKSLLYYLGIKPIQKV